MHFCLVDAVLELAPDRIVAIKNVSAAEEYLQDHFPTFPVLPGVLMIESMVQAARTLLASRDPAEGRHVLGGVRALKYGALVRPGDALHVDVSLIEATPDGSREFRGTGQVLRAGRMDGAVQTAVSGRFTLRPVRLQPLQ